MAGLQRRTFLAVGLATGGTLLAAGTARKSRAEELRDLSGLVPANPPTPAPAFAFTDAEGRRLTLADYKGRGVVVNFWATWCGPCVEELPSLDRLARAVAGSGLAVLPLSSDRGGAPVVQRFYQAHAIASLPVLLDPDMAAVHALGLQGVPTTLLIDRDGQERGRFEGSADWGSADATAKVTALIGGAARPQTGAT